jgi:hypothetical protein
LIGGAAKRREACLPIDYDPKKDIQVYSGLQNQTMTERTKKLCPSHEGGNNYWSTSFSQRTRLLYIPSRPTCNEMTMTPDLLRNSTGAMLGEFPRKRGDPIRMIAKYFRSVCSLDFLT